MPARSFWSRPPVLLGLALCALAIVLTLIGKLAVRPDAGKATALTATRGSESYPAFSPDGRRLFFSARNSKNENFHIFARTLPRGDRSQLTNGASSDVAPAVSPDGSSIAFLRFDGDSASCMIAPVAGGPERKLADCAVLPARDFPLPAMAWMPDSQWLAVSTVGDTQQPLIAIVSAAGGALKGITSPLSSSLGDSSPAVSPDGQSVAFVRWTSAEGADIYVCSRSGGDLNRVTFDDRPIRGLAWSPDGAALIYAGFRMGSWRLWRVPAAGGSPAAVQEAGAGAQFPALAPAASRMVYARSETSAAVWRAPLGSNSEGEPLIRSTGREYSPVYSPDGNWIAYISDQSGADELWLSDAKIRHSTQLTKLNGNGSPNTPSWSADGKSLAFAVREMNATSVDVIPVDGGGAKRVLADANDPSWSPDGKSIYFTSRNTVWKAASDGSNRQIITPQGGFGVAQPEESPDGKYVYYRQWRSIWRIPTAGGAPEEFIQPERGMIFGGPRVTAKGVYFVEAGNGRRAAALSFYDFATKKSSILFETDRIDRSGLSVSPDGKYVLFPRVDESDTTLMLVEGFR